MKKTLLSMAFALLMGASAQASLLGNLSVDGVEDIFSNAGTFGMAVNFNNSAPGNGTNLGIGDVVFNITTVVNSAGNRVVTISSLEVNGISVSPSGVATLQFGAVANTLGAPVNNTINANYSTGRTGAAGNTNLFPSLNHSDLNLKNFATALGFAPAVTANIAPNAAFLVLSSTTAPNPTAIDVTFSGNGDRSDLNGLDILRTPANFGPSNYTLDLVGGFNAGDYYEVKVTDPSVAALDNLRHNGSSANSPTTANGNNNVFATSAGGFSSLWNNFGPTVNLLPVLASNTSGGNSFHEIALTGGSLNAIANTGGPGNNFAEEYMYGGAVTFTINPNVVPEPASMLIWAGLGVAGLVGYRRRKTA